MNTAPGATSLATRGLIRPSAHPTTDLLVGFPHEVVTGMLAAGKVQRFEPHRIVVRTGEPATRLFLLKSGSVNLYRLTEEGQQIQLRRLAPGEAFGLGTLLAEPTSYIATAETVSESIMIVWEHRQVRRFALDHPELAINIVRITLEYIRLYSNRHRAIVSENAEDRLAGALTRLGNRIGLPDPEGKGIEVDITNKDLASLADIGSFTASHLLNKWERRGAVEKTRGKVIIRNPEMLIADRKRPAD